MLNKLIVIGNVGREPSMQYTQSGAAVTNFSVAVQGYKKDVEPQWFNVVAWGKQAESCNQYVHKGMKVFIEGEVKLNQWQDQEGRQRAGLELNARNVLFLSRKEDSGSGQSYGSGNSNNQSYSQNQEQDPGYDDLPW